MNRILLAIDSLERGGAQKNFSILAKKLSSDGNEVVILTLDPVSNDYYKFSKNIKRISIGCKRKSKNIIFAIYFNLYRIKRISSEIKKNNPNVIISFINMTNIVVLFANFFHKKKIIVSERNSILYQKLPLIWRFLRNFTYRYANFITANSIDTVNQLKLRFKNEKILYTPNFVEKPKLFHKSKNKKFVLSVGRLHPQKRFDKLLIDFIEYLQSKSELNLIILGSGNEEKKLKEIIPKKFKNRIFFPGKVDSRKFLSEANMFILTSDYEGMPNVVLEAMSYSLPIVIYKANNEIDSFLKHNHSAFFLDKVRKKMKLKDILRNYDKNSSDFRKMGLRAKTRFDMIDNKKIYEIWRNVAKN